MHDNNSIKAKQGEIEAHYSEVLVLYAKWYISFEGRP